MDLQNIREKLKLKLPIITLTIFCLTVFAFYFLSLPEPINIDSPKFVGKVTQLYFIFTIEFVAIFLIIRNLNPRNNIFYELIATCLLISFFAPEFLEKWTYPLNQMITYFTPKKLNDIILGPQQLQQIWPFPVIFINCFIMYVKHSYLASKNKVKKIGLKKLLVDSLSLYGGLIFLLWVQSHFSYVDAFFSYMTSETRFVHAVLNKNEDKPEYLKDFNILYAETKDDIGIEILKRYENEGDHIKNTINNVFLSKIKYSIGIPGYQPVNLTWDSMHYFEDWVSYLNNTSNNISVSNTELIINKLMYPDRKLEKLQFVRQGILYVKKADNRPGYYYYFSITDTFQKNPSHYIYIISFLPFNIVMIISISYLYLHHKRKVFTKEKAEV